MARLALLYLLLLRRCACLLSISSVTTISNIVQNLEVERDSGYLEHMFVQVLMYLPVMKVMCGGDLIGSGAGKLGRFHAVEFW